MGETDSISRQAAYATALAMYVRCDTDNIEDYRDLMCESILALPSAQPERWIPCSERLPEELGDYLVSIKRVGWNFEEYVENDIAYWDDLEGFHKADKVIAWMPLPEPYKGEQE